MTNPDASLAPWPTAYRLNALLALVVTFGRPEYLVKLASELASAEVARALAYGAAHYRGETDDGSPDGGPRYVEDGYTEAWVVAEQALAARVELDLRWPELEGDTWGRVGAGIAAADELAEEHLDAFRAVSDAAWEALEARDPVSFESGLSWWGDLRAAVLADKQRDD